MAVICECRCDHLAGSVNVGNKLARHRRRNLRQRLHHLAMPYQMHEAAHCVVFGRVIWNSGATQQIADRLLGADPDRKHGLGRHAVLGAISLDHAGHGRGGLVRARDRGLNVHHQHGVIAGIGQQHLERRRITRGIGVADDVDRVRSGPCRGQDRIQLFADRG
jgi:hypothetical protein